MVSSETVSLTTYLRQLRGTNGKLTISLLIISPIVEKGGFEPPIPLPV